MPRPLSIIFVLNTAALGVLAVAWIASLFFEFFLSRGSYAFNKTLNYVEGTDRIVALYQGQIGYELLRTFRTDLVPDKGWTFSHAPLEDRHSSWSPYIGELAFGSLPTTGTDTPSTISYAVIPVYIPFLVLSLWPAYIAWRHLRHSADGAEQACKNCGYDLRATPERCPECRDRCAARSCDRRVNL